MKEPGYLAAVAIENDSIPFPSVHDLVWALTLALTFGEGVALTRTITTARRRRVKGNS
jgi:hypothetical protein